MAVFGLNRSFIPTHRQSVILSAAFQGEGPAFALSLRTHEMQVLRLDKGGRASG